MEKGSLSEKSIFRNFLEFLEFRDSRDSREPQILENIRKSDHVLEMPENLEKLEILEIPPVKRPISYLFLVPKSVFAIPFCLYAFLEWRMNLMCRPCITVTVTVALFQICIAVAQGATSVQCP